MIKNHLLSLFVLTLFFVLVQPTPAQEPSQQPNNFVFSPLKPFESRFINTLDNHLEPEHDHWLVQVGQCFITISGLFAIPWIFTKEPSRLDELSGMSGGGRQILRGLLDIFNSRHMQTDEKDILECRSTNNLFSFVILIGHMAILSAILGWPASLIIMRLTDWSIPEWALFMIPFIIIAAIEFPLFYGGQKTQTELFIQRLATDSRLRNLMGYMAMVLFFLGLLIYYGATGVMLEPLPDWAPDL
jgi:hypothetical protein